MNLKRKMGNTLNTYSFLLFFTLVAFTSCEKTEIINEVLDQTSITTRSSNPIQTSMTANNFLKETFDDKIVFTNMNILQNS